MFSGLNFSVYMSEAERQLPLLEVLLPNGSFVFTSFHIAEEADKNYRAKAVEVCRRLKDGGYRIMADVSARTLRLFESPGLEQFADTMGIDLLRIDYGMSDEELVALAGRRSIVINCSTVSRQTALRLGSAGKQVYGLHNFYPRPETGLDSRLFVKLNSEMRAAGIEPMAFIAGDTMLRGPLYEGLPTLEEHRGIPPYAAYLSLAELYGIDGIFVGDGLITPPQYSLIEAYRGGVIQVPAELSGNYRELYGRVFTVRIDSPAPIARFAESREYSSAIPNLSISPCECIERAAGCITIDNRDYSRYQGEIQLAREPLGADKRVNVIGRVKPDYISLLPAIANGKSFTLTEV